MKDDPAFSNEFDFVILIATEYRRKNIEISQWLTDNINPSGFEELYAQYWPSDGKWHTGASTVLWGAAFKNEEDALAFKLRWM